MGRYKESYRERISKHADSMISLMTFSFGINLIPQVIDVLSDKATTNPLTCLLTATALSVIAICLWSKHLIKAAMANVFTISMWLLLFILSVI